MGCSIIVPLKDNPEWQRGEEIFLVGRIGTVAQCPLAQKKKYLGLRIYTSPQSMANHLSACSKAEKDPDWRIGDMEI